MTQADRIIAKFPTQEALATELGLHQSAIAGWKKRGYVPVRQHEHVLRAAAKLRIKLTPADFYEAPRKAAPPS